MTMALPQSTRPLNTRWAARTSLWLGLWVLALPALAQVGAGGSLGTGSASAMNRPAPAALATTSAVPTPIPTAIPTAFAPATPTAPAGPASGALPTADHEPLFAQARQWVMAREQLPADQVRFAALDSRVRIAPCQEPLQFDYPFSSSRETVRVRCGGPTAWQLFLRLNNLPVAQVRPASNPNGPAVPAPGRAGAAVTLQPPMKTVVVAKRLLPRGSELDASMLEEVQKPALGLDPLAIGSLKDVARAEAVRDLPAGTVLRSYDIKRSLMVRKGQLAMLTVGQNGSFQITVRVEAQQDGHLGEQIRLKNPESGRLISGVVTGPNALKGL